MGVRRFEPGFLGSPARKRARDDELVYVGLSSSVKFSRKSLDLPHSAYARRAPFVAYATFPPFDGGIAPKGKAEKCGIAPN